MKRVTMVAVMVLTCGIQAAVAAEAPYCRDSIAVSETLRMGAYDLDQATAAMARSCRPGDVLRLNAGSFLVQTVCNISKPVIPGGSTVTCTMGKPRPVR